MQATNKRPTVRPPVVDAPLALMTADDIASYIRMQKPWIYCALRDGLFPEPAIRDIRMTRWLRKDIDAWVLERSAAPRSTAGIESGKRVGAANRLRAEVKRLAAAGAEEASRG